MSRKKNVIPDYESVTPILKGQASKIFKEVVDQDKVLIVQKQNKPQAHLPQILRLPPMDHHQLFQ